MSSEVRRMQLTDLPDVLRNERRGYTHPWTEGGFQGLPRQRPGMLVVDV